MSQKQKIDTSSSQREGSGVFITQFLPNNPASLNNIRFQELAILPGGEILYNTDRIDPVAQADGPGNKIKELETTKESRERDESEIRGYDFFLSLTRSVFTIASGAILRFRANYYNYAKNIFEDVKEGK